VPSITSRPHCHKVLESIDDVISILISRVDDQTVKNINRLNQRIQILYNLINLIRRLNLTSKEFAYLKAAILFCPDYVPLEQRDIIQLFRCRIIEELREETPNINGKGERISKLLLLLPSVRTLPSTLVEDLFFSGLIGDVQIDSIILQILDLSRCQPPSSDLFPADESLFFRSSNNRTPSIVAPRKSFLTSPKP